MSRAFRVGFFVVLALVFLSAGVFLVGDKEFLFNSTYLLKTDFPNAAGLNNGAEVRVAGVHEGTVMRTDLPSQPGGKVTVLMKLHSSTRNIIRKDSIAAIKTEGLLGNKYVEISLGSEKAQAVMNDDVIAGEASQDIADQAKSLAANAQAGVKAFRDDMEALQQNFLLRGFFTRRGYNDSSELSKHAISKVPSGPPHQGIQL